MDKELQCYGMRQEDIERDYMNGLTARLSGKEMVVAGILSDCQELAAFNGDKAKEDIRKQLNVAKYMLFKMIGEREALEKKLAALKKETV